MKEKSKSSGTHEKGHSNMTSSFQLNYPEAQCNHSEQIHPCNGLG